MGETSKAKHERIPVPKINTPKGTTNNLYKSRVVVQVVMRQTVTAAAQVQSQANALSTFCGKTGSETNFPASTSVLPYTTIISPTLNDISKRQRLKTIHLITI
jgi:hypothetical protein